jgi:hypothetical protein
VIAMKLILADETPRVRYKVSRHRDNGTVASGTYATRAEAAKWIARWPVGSREVFLGQSQGLITKVEVIEEPWEPKSSHVIIVNNGDGEPRVYGRWFTARAANRSAERYAKAHPSRMGTIRVCAMLQPRR